MKKEAKRLLELNAAVVDPVEFDPVGDLRAFHQKFGLEYGGKPRALPPGLADLRAILLHEEINEYFGHTAYIDNELQKPPALQNQAHLTFHLSEQLDALVDLVYVALGNANLHGFDFKEAWRRVHAANMAKVRAQRPSDSKRGSSFDVVKPIGWKAPSHMDLVEDHTHKGE